MNKLEAVFANLDRWRHLPNYQLERRADILFSAYLAEVIAAEQGTPVEDVIVPELPIKRDLIWPELPTDKSVKVDYVLFAKDRSKVFFVELKTDSASRRDDQDKYLRESKRLGFGEIMKGLCSIVRKTAHHQKYHHLLTLLAGLGYITMPDDIRDHVFRPPGPGLRERLARVTPTAQQSAVEVVYLQPKRPERPKPEERYIHFDTFASYVDRYDDPLSTLFATHLRRWQDAAGARLPGDP